MEKYTKAIWAMASSAVGAVTTAVASASPHTFTGVHTLGWLECAATVLAVTGGVYGFANQAPPPAG